MSSRVLKKLHGESELEIKEQDEIWSDVENDIGNGTKKKQLNINRYDLFNEQSLSESEVKEDDNETEHASTATPYPVEQAKKKKKKRKKKGGKQQMSSSNRRSSEDKSDMDEIIRTLKEVDKMFGEPRKPVNPDLTTNNPVIKQLLSVQHKNLNPSSEMKRMFGSKVVQAEQNKRRNMRGPRSIKTTWLVSAKENWPPVSKVGIYMTVEQPPDISPTTNRNTSKSLVWFRFEHNATYRQLQHKFLAAVESMDSDNIIQILNQQPYHVDSLIQLSELCKMSEDHAMASQLIEHAILALESSFHSMFSLTAGNCRLDYRRQENRAIFVTLFKHAQYLEGRACCRTALEVSKLILSFDPENDPLAMILVVDYYALRAQQYEWFIQLYREWEGTNNLSQLPNMAYSYALALFYHLGKSSQLADDALQYALIMFPAVLKPLLTELGVQVDSRSNTHSYFGPTAYNSQSPALKQLTSLYTCRSKIIWQDSTILGWLERNVNAVLDSVDAKLEIIKEFSAKRNQRYKTPPKAILRHVILSDFKEKVPLAPFINKDTEPILMYDPLPPHDSINIYNKPNMSSASRVLLDSSPFSMFFQSLLPNFNVQELAAGPAGAAGGGGAAAAIGGGAAAAAGGGRAADPAAIGGVENRQAIDPAAGGVVAAAAAAAGGGGGLDNEAELFNPEDGAALNVNMQSFFEFRSSLNSIVDAMRDFLTNIRVPERPNDADVDENESSDDEPNDYLT